MNNFIKIGVMVTLTLLQGSVMDPANRASGPFLGPMGAVVRKRRAAHCPSGRQAALLPSPFGYIGNLNGRFLARMKSPSEMKVYCF